ncbi:hypothetical protein E0500_003030 [Streptomyces sp. KM273126]|uniref:hypothetical protein n=1 Tax=Streptomyces sp. KM273126 TaxID=2545247 RepID=UPI0015EC4ADD|nr:hypothetical protein [Streptomyces sp. KM273126]MBA2806455.1 hypothetical protein [Streptomyces sp. KM273126]
MGSVRVTFCSGAAVAVAATLTPGAACPVAYAADGGISVAPSPAVPGSDIQLRAQGCSGRTGRTGTASSEAFVADAVLTTGRGGVLVGETRVRSSLRPGTYRVEVPCDGVGDKIEAMLMVAERAGARGPSAATTTRAPAAPTAPAFPVAPPFPVASASQTAPPFPVASASQTAPAFPIASASASASLTAPAFPIASASMTAPGAPVASASPVEPLGVGGGGAAHVVAKENRELNPRGEGPGARHAVVGLVLASVAALVVVRRGARRGRGTE